MEVRDLQVEASGPDILEVGEDVGAAAVRKAAPRLFDRRTELTGACGR